MTNNILHSSLILKLNNCWQGIGYMTVKDAFNRLFTSTGALLAMELVLHEDGTISNHSRTFTGEEWMKLPVRENDNWIGLSRGRRVRVPLVTITPGFIRLPKVQLQFNKKGLYTRDRGICSYCREMLTIDEATNDHVIPVSRGGQTTWENCTLSCAPCNTFKADRTPAEAGMHLRRIPQVPGLVPIMPELRSNSPQEHIALLSHAA